MKHFGFEMRIKGSHHIFRREGIEEKPNLQKEGNKAKPYQVKQDVTLFSNIDWEVKIDN